MVCNTIHTELPRLQPRLNTPILDLPALVRARIKRDRIRKIALIGTPATIRSGLFSTPDCETLLPTPPEQHELVRSIIDFNAGNRTTATRTVERISRNHCPPAERVLAACTELALMLRHSPIPTIDPMEILLDEIIERYTHQTDHE
jgi:aspartate/glutamate racemase